MRKKSLPLIENVEITDIAAEGRAVAKADNLVVFVKHGVPGDCVNVQLTKKRSSWAEGKITQYHKLSEQRTDPFCKHFGECGGCKWQFMQYETQLFYKQKQVEDALQRIAGIRLSNNDSSLIHPIIPSSKTTYYRNKLEFTFSNRRWYTQQEMNDIPEVTDRSGVALGFHIPGMFDRVLDIETCWLQPDPSNQIRNKIKTFALENNLSFFDIRKQEGFLRNLIVRSSSSGELMVIVTVFEDHTPFMNKLLDYISETFSGITSLHYIINPKKNDSIADLEVHTYKGRGYIYEFMDGLKFKIGPKSFFQTNADQALALYRIARDYAGLTRKEIVYDLYTGTGTIANFIAKDAKKVIGIEYINAAIEDAKENSIENKIHNTHFVAGDIKDLLCDRFVEENGKPDVIITDPPRAGMHPDVVRTISEMTPGKIIYISCNPATQARDLILLLENYSVTKVQPVDMFPHTEHVENVVLLERKT